MSEKMMFRLAARCEAAGRPNNEDNYQVDADLSADHWEFQRDKVVSLGEKGALLLVCDGMGGMNAGEVASKIAVDTVKLRFSKDNLVNEVLATDEQRRDFIRQVIQEADANIKQESRADAAKSGMGSTIVLAWLVDKKVYVGWCGDSRAYKYNPQRGFVQLSHDHSYVQELVDAGRLSPELAFDHPNNNVITRSLGDPRGVAQPDVKVFPLEENDVILLCSDGLCGVLRDREMEQVIAGHQSSMASCCDALWEAARNAGWHDNVTIALAQIMSQKPMANDIQAEEQKLIEKQKNKNYLKIGLTVLAALLVALAAVLVFGKYSGGKEENTSVPNQCDQYKTIVERYQKMKPLESDEEIESVLSNISAIKDCDGLNATVLQYTDTHLISINEKVQSNEFGEDDVREVKDKLNQIKNELINK